MSDDNSETQGKPPGTMNSKCSQCFTSFLTNNFNLRLVISVHPGCHETIVCQSKQETVYIGTPNKRNNCLSQCVHTHNKVKRSNRQ